MHFNETISQLCIYMNIYQRIRMHAAISKTKLRQHFIHRKMEIAQHSARFELDYDIRNISLHISYSYFIYQVISKFGTEVNKDEKCA